MLVFFVNSATNMNDERVFLVEQFRGGGWKTYSEGTIEIEMKLGIYVPINVDTLMSIGNDLHNRNSLGKHVHLL